MFSRKLIHSHQLYRIQGDLYTLIKPIGYGTYGSVWMSKTQNGEYVAVKVFNFNQSSNNIDVNERLNSFNSEVQMANRLLNESEYVVTMYGYEFQSKYNLAFIVLELADELFLDRIRILHKNHLNSKYSESDDFISSKDRQNIWIQLINILLALHRHGVVHRDLKPANLLYFGKRLKVIDFGSAQDEFAGYSGRQRIGGSRPYSAPECFSGQIPITSKADIWSVGAILYFLTYGKRPIYENPRPPNGVSSTSSHLVQDILHHCLQRNPNRRPDHQWLVQHPLTKSSRLGFLNWLRIH
ncbi:unnamed protein product [Adineta ricciae]|uniref:Protein kinase domain-containing protein n=1 Tax=Adineta ricciae TaxID=249248 RepID=A0A815TYX9_ADIRI|nr:unnamed protein product [Adineta ricciae]CAF1514930.1 unnamed protein product [Adineta ricciae]